MLIFYFLYDILKILIKAKFLDLILFVKLIENFMTFLNKLKQEDFYFLIIAWCLLDFFREHFNQVNSNIWLLAWILLIFLWQIYRNKIKIKKIRESAILPKRATKGSAGYDLFACLDSDICIKKGDLVKIPCGIAIELPSDKYVALIFARSGLGIKHGISLANGVGVVDSDYRGEIQVGLCKIAGDEDYIIKNGDRIAQLVITEISCINFKLVKNLSNSERNQGGFGSTGK